MELTTIRQNIFRYIAKQNQIVIIDDCIALIIVEILGYLNIKNSNEFGEWSSICLRVKDFKGLTKEGLLQKIKTEILDKTSIKQKQQLLGNKAIYDFNGNNLRFNDERYVDFKNSPVNLRTNYGDKPYLPNLENIKLAIENKSIDKIKQTSLNEVLSEEEAALNIFWKKLESEERKALFPFWKWKINTLEYQELEAKLKVLLSKYKKKDVIERHAFKLALYYAEWYKRKYIGNNSKIEKVFVEIKLESVWNYIDDKIRTKYLYTINKSERRDDSLKLLGGLPLSYITSEDKNSNLSLKFSKLFRDINSEKTLNIEDLGLNNQSMNKSAQNGGSIYGFISELLKAKFPFADSDMELSPFKEFKSFVEGGLKEYKDEKKKKFLVNWLVEQHSTYEHIYPYLQIKLKPEEDNESHRFISKDRLSKWGIDNSISHFEIIVRLNFQVESKDFCGYYFNLCANGKFISRSGENWKLPLWNLPQKPLSIEIILRTEEINISLQKEEVPNYIQLWNIEFGIWQSRAKNGKLSAVLFLYNGTYAVDSAQSKTIFTKDRINSFRWAIIDRELIISDNGKVKTLYQKDGCIEVRPKNTKPFSNAIFYDEEGMVKYVEEESEKKVYLVKGNVDFGVKYITKSLYRYKNKIEEKKADEYFVEYKTSEMSDYFEYSSFTKLKQGFIKFRISSEPYKEIIECYWLQENALINRDVYSRRITLKEIDVIGLPNNQYSDREENLDVNYIPIKIGDEKAYVELDIYRALNRSNDLLVDEKYETSRNIIPIKFADNFTIRAIDSNGLQLHKLSDEIDKYQKIRVINNNCNLIDDSTGIKFDLPGLKTFTKEILTYKGFYYFPDSARKTIAEFEKYKFFYLTLETNKIERIDYIIEKVDNIDRIGFRLKKETNGIVSQSLKTDIFQETYRPFFVSTTDNKFHSDVKKNDRVNRILKYKENFENKLFEDKLYDLALTHFNIAVEHNLYFGMFDIFWALEDNSTFLSKFYLYYYSKMQENVININELNRFAEEMLFDWMLIPRKVWLDVIGKKMIKEKQEWTSSLFRQKDVSNGSEKYALSQYCDKYWESKHDKQNNKNILYINIKRANKIDAFFKLDSKSKIDILKTIDQSTDIYTTLLETI